MLVGVKKNKQNGKGRGVCARAFRCKGEESEFVDKEGRETVFG